MSASLDDNLPAYIVNPVDTKFDLVDRTGRTILSCRDRPSAEHHASLMNAAFERGYKQCLKDRRNAK